MLPLMSKYINLIDIFLAGRDGQRLVSCELCEVGEVLYMFMYHYTNDVYVSD